MQLLSALLFEIKAVRQKQYNLSFSKINKKKSGKQKLTQRTIRNQRLKSGKLLSIKMILKDYSVALFRQ